MARGINKLEELREASGRWAAEPPTDSIPCRTATEQAGDRTVASGCTARHLIPFGLCSYYNQVRGPGLVHCPSRGREKSPQMNIYRMESNTCFPSPALTSLETDAGLRQRPESCSSHHSGHTSWRWREPTIRPAEWTLQIVIQQLMSLPKLSCGPGTGRSLQCLTPQKYIILHNILWFTKHFLIIILLGFIFYFCPEYCLSRLDDSSTSHLPQFLPCEPIPTCVHLDILSCPHVLFQPYPTQAAELWRSIPEILHLEGWLSPLVVIFPVA